MSVYRAPEHTPKSDRYSIFLAGTIDMGNSEDWQSEIEKEYGEIYDIYNPRRTDWDSSWKQEKKNKQFNEQVTWELDHLQRADVIIMNILGDSKSPISLLELGAFKDKSIYVCCPEEFYRHGNVDIFCEMFEIPLFDNMEDLLKLVTSTFKPKQ